MSQQIDVIHVVLDIRSGLPLSAYVDEDQAALDYPDSAIVSVPLEDIILTFHEEE